MLVNLMAHQESGKAILLDYHIQVLVARFHLESRGFFSTYPKIVGGSVLLPEEPPVLFREQIRGFSSVYILGVLGLPAMQDKEDRLKKITVMQL